MLGRYFSERDIGFITGINNELLGDIIQQVVTVYKICPDNTQVNVYGEKKGSVTLSYFPGIDIVCLIERADMNTTTDDFGPTRSQNVIFKFLEKDLESINFFPEVGNIIEFNTRYYECDNVVQGEQLLGGQPEKSFGVICHCHYTRLSKSDVVVRQS